MTELNFTEFGKTIEVSQQFLDRCSDEEKKIVYKELQYSFDTAKSIYFPKWEGSFTIRQYGPFSRKSVARIDGGEVPDEVIEKYVDWIFGNRLIFEFGDEYEEKEHNYYGFTWYAQVPKEFVKQKEKI